MAEVKCPICKKMKENVGPKNIGISYQEPEPPFTQRQLVVKWVVMCKDCLEKFKKGEIALKIK